LIRIAFFQTNRLFILLERAEMEISFFYWKTTCSKLKWTSIATVPDIWLTTLNILTHLISRYQLPLKRPTGLKILPTAGNCDLRRRKLNQFLQKCAAISFGAVPFNRPIGWWMSECGEYSHTREWKTKIFTAPTLTFEQEIRLPDLGTCTSAFSIFHVFVFETFAAQVSA
jgi:hypothetical protein